MLRNRFIINASGSITTIIGAKLPTSFVFKSIPNIKPQGYMIELKRVLKTYILNVLLYDIE